MSDPTGDHDVWGTTPRPAACECDRCLELALAWANGRLCEARLTTVDAKETAMVDRDLEELREVREYIPTLQAILADYRRSHLPRHGRTT